MELQKIEPQKMGLQKTEKEGLVRLEEQNGGEIARIFFDVKDQSIDVFPSFDGKIHIEYREESRDEYSYIVQGAEIRLVHRYRGILGPLLSFRRRVISLSLPASYDGLIDLKTRNASISVKNLPDLFACTAVSTNGSVQLEAISCGKLVARTSNGKLLLRGISAQDVQAQTSNGAVEMTDSTVSGQVVAQTGNGSLRAESVWARAVQLSTSNGRVHATGVTCTDLLSLKTANAAISVSALSAPSICLVTSNGCISGSVCGKRGDYSVRSDTSNGKNNLGYNDDPSLPKKLEARTSNGAIAIDFLG